jgi:hypothetical protein
MLPLVRTGLAGGLAGRRQTAQRHDLHVRGRPGAGRARTVPVRIGLIWAAIRCSHSRQNAHRNRNAIVASGSSSAAPEAYSPIACPAVLRSSSCQYTLLSRRSCAVSSSWSCA